MLIALRLRKICSNKTDYQKSLSDLKNTFLKRGYQRNHLSKQFDKASLTERSQLLTYKEKNEQKSNQLLFITTHNKTLPRIKTAIEKHWNLLQINDNKELQVLRTKAKIGVPEEQKSSRLHWSNNYQKQQGFEEKGLERREVPPLSDKH